MKLPKMKKDGSNQADIHEVAQVYIHEVGHNLNLRHKEMVKWWDIPVNFIDAGKVDFKMACSPKRSTVEKNEEKARKKLAEWEKKLNRAKTFVKKYKQKVKYYDKKKEQVMV